MTEVKQSYRAANLTALFMWGMQPMMEDALKHRQYDKYLCGLLQLSPIIMDFIDSTNINCDDPSDRKMNLDILQKAFKIYNAYGIAWDKLNKTTGNPDLQPILDAWYRIKGLLPKETNEILSVKL